MFHLEYDIFSLMIVLTIITNKQKIVDSLKMQVNTQPVSNEYLNKNDYAKLVENKLIAEDELILRLPSNSLLKYTAYKDVSILHFQIPSDTKSALFTFKAFEESKGAFQRKCQPRNVSVHLKAGSYPVITPENISFPRNFLNADQRFKIYNLHLESNDSKKHIHVNGPVIGNWFAVAFQSWSDPNNERIEQQGLTASCETILTAELSVQKFQPLIINNKQMIAGRLHYKPDLDIHMKGVNPIKFLNSSSSYRKSNNSYINENKSIYKLYVLPGIGIATAHITITKACIVCPDIEFLIQANAYPYNDRHALNESYHGRCIHRSVIKPNQTGKITTKFYVHQKNWHYAVIKFINSTQSPNIIKNSDRVNTKSTIHPLEYKLQIVYNESNNLSLLSKEPNEILVKGRQPELFLDIKFYPLLRQTYREFFMFDYDLIPDENGTVPPLLNLTAGSITGLSFEIGEVYDNGGTLTFALSMKKNQQNSSDFKKFPIITPELEENGIWAEKLIGVNRNIEANDNSLSRSNQTIIICVHLGEPGIPTWPDKCRYGRVMLSASIIVNNTDANTSTALIHIPFPESGQWYITMSLYCHGAETAAGITIMDSLKEFVKKYINTLEKVQLPCACANNIEHYQYCVKDQNCLNSLNETETLKIKECLMDSKCTTNYIEMTQNFEIHHRLATEQHFAIENCNTSVVFSISSSPCVTGRCGRFGRCYHYMSGGFVFSTCVCMKGYRGWDCSEDSQVPSNMSILVALLLLTLSNLLFFPSIYITIQRKYYTEAVIYFFAMFFSIFYHACDSGEDEYSFCLVKIGVLQFCDFYCGLLAIWVTLVAMSHVRPQFVSLLQMFGAILLAFGTELNKQSLWVFLAPSLTGICLISASWGLRCYKSRTLFPSRQYLTVYMPLGMVLVMIGLVCYAFLQTKQNYHIVHSIWHMVMALSILCLLPSKKYFFPKC